MLDNVCVVVESTFLLFLTITTLLTKTLTERTFFYFIIKQVPNLMKTFVEKTFYMNKNPVLFKYKSIKHNKVQYTNS